MTQSPTRQKPDLSAQFKELPNEFEGMKWQNVYLHPNGGVMGAFVFQDIAVAKMASKEMLCELASRGGRLMYVQSTNTGNVIRNDCICAIQIPVMGE